MSTRTASQQRHAHAAELAVAIEAARAAAAIQVEHYERLEHIVKKSARDVVTEADHLSESAIIAAIRQRFPDDEILAEESGHSAASAGSGPVDGSGASAPVDAGHRIWVIDPLDGTVNYAAGIPHFCTSVGLVVGGVPTVGVATCSAPFGATARGWATVPSTHHEVTWVMASSPWPCRKPASRDASWRCTRRYA